MDKNLHRSVFRLHGTCGTTQRLNGNESVQSFDLITRWSKFLSLWFSFSQTRVNTWTGHVFEQFARKPSYAHLISRTHVNRTTCNSNYIALCK